MSIHLESFVCGPLPNNLYLLRDDVSRQVVVIDPSIESSEAQSAMTSLQNEGYHLQAIWNTHGHFDHIYDNALWKRQWPVPILMHPADLFLVEHLREQSIFLGFAPPEVASPEGNLADGDELMLGAHRIQVLLLPGHSPGSVAFYLPEARLCISGDVLFQNGVGRTDLPGCSEAELKNSLRRLAQLPPDTRILPGHGPETTVGDELRDNPHLQFLRDENLRL